MDEPTATLDDVAQSVATLADAVEGMRQGLVDEETVRRIATEVIATQAAAAPAQNRRSYEPDDDLGAAEPMLHNLKGRKLVHAIHSAPAAAIAKLVRKPVDDVREFQHRGDQLVLLASIMDVNPRETSFFADEYLPALHAMDSTTTAEGDEFVPLELSPTLIERVNLQLRVLAQFIDVDMPTQPFEIPGKSVGRQRLGSHAEQTADTGQTKIKKVTAATRKVQLDAKKFAGETLTSKELEEDAILAIMPFIEEELVDYLAADLEDTGVNGDTAGTHQDSDTTAADDPRKNWEGIRQLAPAAAKTDAAAAAALTVAFLRGNRKKMGKYGISPSSIFHLVSMAGYIQLLADANVLTVDKYGPSAPILTGELGKADGAPLIVSEYVRTDLNATGVHDGVTTTRMAAHTIYSRGIALGTRRGLTVQVLRELYAESDQDAVIVTTRKALAARFPATEPIVASTYNVTS